MTFYARMHPTGWNWRPRIRTIPDPVSSLPRRPFNVVQLCPRRSRRIHAVSPSAAKFAGAVLMGVHASRLVAVEIQPRLPGSSRA